MKRSGRPNAFSERRKSEWAERAIVVEQAFERDRRTCQARERVPSVRCGGRLDPHEIIPRSAWRRGYLVLANVLTICRNHHRWVDAEPDAAHEVGLHGYSWEVPAATME